MRKVALLVVAVFLIAAAPAAGRGSFSSGSKSSSSSSSGSKSSSSSKTYSNGASKPTTPTSSKPSLGSRPQPAPVTKLVPPTPPPTFTPGSRTVNTPAAGRVTIPSGRSYTTDRSYIISHPSYANPYGSTYYGAYDSPFYYMWLYSIVDDDESNDALPPSSDSEVSEAALSYLGVVESAVNLVGEKGEK